MTIDLERVYTATALSFAGRFGIGKEGHTDRERWWHVGHDYRVQWKRATDEVIISAPTWRLVIGGDGGVYWPNAPLSLTFEEADALALALAYAALVPE